MHPIFSHNCQRDGKNSRRDKSRLAIVCEYTQILFDHRSSAPNLIPPSAVEQGYREGIFVDKGVHVSESALVRGVYGLNFQPFTPVR